MGVVLAKILGYQMGLKAPLSVHDPVRVVAIF
jgi:hypothetical protein